MELNRVLDFLTEEKIRRKCQDWDKNLIVDSSLILQNETENEINNSQLLTQKALTETFSEDKENSLKIEGSSILSFGKLEQKSSNLQNSENIFKNLYFSYQKSPSDSSYREILLSFQTMFTFFQQKNLSQEQTLETISSSSENYEKDKNTERTKEFIKKSIDLASNETLEWRTLYLNQNMPAKNDSK